MMMDFGCGDGGFDEILPDRLHRGSWLALYGNNQSCGIDHNRTKIERARATIKNGTDFHVCDGARLPFAANSIDYIHDYGTLHHMDDYKAGISEIVRVLKSGGELYMVETVDNDMVYKTARRIWGKWRDDKIVSPFTSDDLEDLLRPHFAKFETEYYHRFILSDFLYNYKLEPRASLYLNHWYSHFLKWAGLDQDMCCHVVIRGIKA